MPFDQIIFEELDQPPSEEEVMIERYFRPALEAEEKRIIEALQKYSAGTEDPEKAGKACR